jgi:hypothetical protein
MKHGVLHPSPREPSIAFATKPQPCTDRRPDSRVLMVWCPMTRLGRVTSRAPRCEQPCPPQGRTNACCIVLWLLVLLRGPHGLLSITELPSASRCTRSEQLVRSHEPIASWSCFLIESGPQRVRTSQTHGAYAAARSLLGSSTVLQALLALLWVEMALVRNATCRKT